MFGLRRKEWKHARKEHIHCALEFAAVCVVLAFIMAGLGYLADRDVRSPSVPIALEEGQHLSGAQLAEAEIPPTPQSLGVSEDVPLDPIAAPDWFDVVDALDAFGAIIAHVPSSKAELPKPMEIRTEPSTESHIVVDKVGHTLTLFQGGEFVRQYGVAVGRNPGNKVRKGDMKTPEGTFRITRFHNAESWVHDFGDGKGVIEGAYGPLFIRLAAVPWSGIGIHGTHDPESIGTDATEGCIRMKNDELLELASMIDTETTVTILPN